MEKFQPNESRGYLNWFAKVLDIFFSFYQQTKPLFSIWYNFEKTSFD